MNQKIWTYFGIGYAVLVTSLAVWLWVNQNRPFVINYPEVQISKIVFNPIFHIIQMPLRKVDIIKEYIDSNTTYHQVYADTIDIKSDSLEVYFVNKVDVNVTRKKAAFTREDFKIKTFEKVITQIIEVPKEIVKYADIPFYRENFFWIWFYEKLVIVGTILVVVLL